MLGASDLRYWEELYIEWEYLDDEEGMKHDDRVLFTRLTGNDFVTYRTYAVGLSVKRGFTR